MTSKLTNFSKWVSLLLILATIIAGSPSAAYAQYEPRKTWTTVGSAGTVDVLDLPIAALDGPIASLIPNAPDYSSLDIRYNVVPVEGLFGDVWWYESYSSYFRLKVRYRDELHGAYSIRNPPEITVLVKLKSMNLSTGAVTTLLTFNSNDFYAAPGFQTQASPQRFFAFNFSENAYWVEVQLTHGRLSWLSYSGQPAPAPAALAAVQIELVSPQ